MENLLRIVKYIGDQYKEEIKHEKLMSIGKDILLMKRKGHVSECGFLMAYMIEVINGTVINYGHLFPETEVLKSNIHGNGLFAIQEIPENSIVCFYPVHYAIDIKSEIVVRSPMLDTYESEEGPIKINSRILRDFLLKVDENLEHIEKRNMLIGGHPFIKMSCQNGHFINHADNANAYFKQVGNSGIYIVITERSIKKGEEITVNYGSQFTEKYKN